jgi:hypothetical protein
MGRQASVRGNGCFSRELAADAEYDGSLPQASAGLASASLCAAHFTTGDNGVSSPPAHGPFCSNNRGIGSQELAGGEFLSFHNAKDLKAGLIARSRMTCPNYYVLSFQSPSVDADHPGCMSLRV